MAAIYPVFDGQQDGPPWCELPWLKCVKAFALTSAHWTENAPPSPATIEKHPPFADRIVIRVRNPEAAQHGVKPGFYLSPQSGLEAKFNLDRITAA